jgi:phytoene/squalene synthetase
MQVGASAMSPSRHGLTALKARVAIRGLAAIDKRSAAAQALLGWKADLERDLGGESNVSAQKAALVEMIVRTRLLVEHCDAFIMSQESLVNKKRRSLYPIVEQRTRLCDSLARMLGQLGLERQAKPVKSLGDYLEAKSHAADGESQHASD